MQLLPLEQLLPNPDNPKKPLGLKYKRGLRASLERFGFAGLFNVARNPDGTYEVLDGNTRLEELERAGVESVPCVVHDLPLRDDRREFILSFDRNRKVFDEDAVLAQLEDLVAKGKDLRELATLTAKDNLERLLGERSMAGSANAGSGPKQAAVVMGSMVLYGPVSEMAEIAKLLKTVKGKLTFLEKARKVLGQSLAFLDWSDERLLAVLLATLGRFQAEGES